METEFQLPLTKNNFSRSAAKQLYLWGGGGDFALAVAASSSPGLLVLVPQSRRRQCCCCKLVARETDIIFHVENQNANRILSDLHAKKTRTHKLGQEPRRASQDYQRQ